MKPCPSVLVIDNPTTTRSLPCQWHKGHDGVHGHTFKIGDRIVNNYTWGKANAPVLAAAR